MTPESYTVTTAAAATGLSTKTIDRACKAKDAGDLPLLPPKRVGNRRVILAADLRQWLANLPDA